MIDPNELVGPLWPAPAPELTGWSGSVSFRPGDEDRPPREAAGAVDCRTVRPTRRIDQDQDDIRFLAREQARNPLTTYCGSPSK